MGSLHDTVTWYKIRHTGWQNYATVSKTKRFQPAKRDSSLFWMSQCGACHPTGQILYHVTVSCKGPICFTDQCFARLKHSFSLLPLRKLLIWAVNSSIAQSHYCISNDVKAKLSRKLNGKMTFFTTAFAKPMKIRARLFLFDRPIKCFA